MVRLFSDPEECTWQITSRQQRQTFFLWTCSFRSPNYEHQSQLFTSTAGKPPFATMHLMCILSDACPSATVSNKVCSKEVKCVLSVTVVAVTAAPPHLCRTGE